MCDSIREILSSAFEGSTPNEFELMPSEREHHLEKGRTYFVLLLIRLVQLDA